MSNTCISTEYTNVFTGWKFQDFGPYFLVIIYSQALRAGKKIIKSLR